MPEQQSRRGNTVTQAAFEAPFQTQIVRYGVKGLNLHDALDALDGWSRLTNLDHDNSGELVVRPGQTALATGGTKHHSIRLFHDEQTGVDTRAWGIDTHLYLGLSGALASIDSGYSGDPLTLLPHRPPLSGDPWLFVADRSRMRKVRADGLVIPIGLPAPSAAAAASLGTEYRTGLVACDSSDSTQASAWTGVAGLDDQGHVTGVPSVADDHSSPDGTNLYFVTNVGTTVVAPYYSWWGVPITRDGSLLTAIGGGPTTPASDDDVFHVWLKTSHPQLVEEIRLYVVCSATFDPKTLPGADTTGAGVNADAYFKGFRPSDFVQSVLGVQTQIQAAETARVGALRDEDLQRRAITDPRDSWAIPRAVTDPARAASLQLGTGSHQWFERGNIGVSLRRGDFQRIGLTAGRDWSTITGFVLYVRVNTTQVTNTTTGVVTTEAVNVGVGLDDVYLTGGFGPDTVEPGAEQYDWRYTHYDPRTGAEGNGSPEMTTKLDAIRRQINVQPTAYGDSAVRQRFYRRGGSLIDDWYFLGENTSDGGLFADGETDDGIVAAGTIDTDHYQPVPTVDDAGNTVLAQPLPTLWGPVEGMLFGCGDPYRPGHVYFCLPDAPDHWSATGNVEVCPPSEVLMNGGLMGQQAFVFSKQRLYALYPNLTGTAGDVTAAPTLCKAGLLGRWALAVGPGGIYFVAEDGVFVTTGGPETWLSKDIQPLFQGQTVNGYAPIDKTVTTMLRLTIWDNKLYFQYQDTNGAVQVVVYALLQQFWRHYTFGRAPAVLQGEEEATLVLGGLASGASYLFSGTSDDGIAIDWTVRTGAVSGGVREEKLFGDQFVDLDRDGETITVQNFLNEETVANLTQTIDADTGRQRYILDAFGEGPQKAHSLSCEVRGATAAGRPTLYQLGVAVALQPDLTSQRVTNWDDLGSADEVWLTGVTFDCDTGGVEKTVLIERDYGGVRDTIATLTVSADGRHKQTFSWPAVPARMVRVRPDSDICEIWLLYRADWIWQVEPPRISKWDIHFENSWDQYYTGLDLYCDTAGQTKQVEVYVDNVRLTNDLAGGLTYWPVTTSGRQVVHLTLPWGRGHVFRFRAIDDHPGVLYEHRWQLEAEPSEQANWNQNFSIFGTRADKWLKGVVFECDTYGQNKSVAIEVDGVTVETIAVNANGRKVVQKTLTSQQLGRVWRLFPVDGNPGRLYSVQPIFDEEPLQLARWETQEQSFGLPGWFVPLFGHLVVKASAPVTLTIAMQQNEPRVGSQARTVETTYTIPATGSAKVSQYVSFLAGKGRLAKFTLTSTSPFWLYRDETVVVIQPWGQNAPVVVRPFGNDDLDPTRTMTVAAEAAARSGGTA